MIFKAVRDQVSIVEKAVPSEEFHKILDAVTNKANQEQTSEA